MEAPASRVLLVDAHAADTAHIKRLLAQASIGRFHVQHVPTLADGLWRMQSGEFDLMVLELELPDSHGLDTLRRARVHCPHVPVVVLTERTDHDLALKALQAGAQDFLVKGRVDAELLGRAIRYAIERQRMLAELEQARQLEHYTATHDQLTGLPNRLLFIDRLNRAVEDARRGGLTLAVLFLDLNRFKHANDTLGHSAGDRLIRMVAQRLTGCVRASDTLARMGGDEFTALLTRVHRPHDVTRIAQKMIEAVERTYVVDGFALNLGVSVGVAMFSADGSDAETLIKHADLAMYRAKAQARSAVEFFRPSMNHRVLERQELENSLRLGLARGEFTARYQPQVDVLTGEVIAMEALLRWKHPQLGTLLPSQFMNLAEETGLVVPMGEWILREACAQARAWVDAGHTPIPVAVNFSSRQFEDAGLEAAILNALVEARLPGELLEVELTEGAVMRNTRAAEVTLERLHQAGIRIALDNFGTGSSSLGQLRRFPLDKLKIGGQFVHSLDTDHGDQDLISAVVGLAQSLRLRPLAEGVETESQMRLLRALNCHRMQGYYFSRPLSAAKAASLLEARAPAVRVPYPKPASQPDEASAVAA